MGLADAGYQAAMTTTLESPGEHLTAQSTGVWQNVTDPIRLLVHGYGFISERCNALGTDVYAARLAGLRVVCLRGAAGAEFFYDDERFRRRDALPGLVLSTLTGHGGAQTLDGAEHRHRKELFMSLMTPESLREIDKLAAAGWADALAKWAGSDRPVVLTKAAAEIFSAAVHRWAGVPLAEADNPERAASLRALYEGPAAPGIRHWRARRERRRLESEMADLVEAVRRGVVDVADDKPLAVVARHRDADEALLPVRIAAVELLNLLRPTVAVERFVCFAALALHNHPHWTGRLVPGVPDRDARIHRFVQEVRRTAPFFPVVGARARRDLVWRGVPIERDGLVLLDLYGTDHDPARWTEPERFDPGRFDATEPGQFDLIPQGGGEFHLHHRCAGEWITIRLMETAVRALTATEFTMPPQDLRVSPRRVPALPKSGVRIQVMRPH
jgi:fatty-acid peroxygenase